MRHPANSERHFLHDVISPLSTATNTLEVLIEQFGDSEENQAFIQKLAPVLGALEKVATLVAERRNYLAEQDEKNENER